MKEEDIIDGQPVSERKHAHSSNRIQSMAGNTSDHSDSKFQVYDNNSILGLSTYEHDKCFME